MTLVHGVWLPTVLPLGELLGPEGYGRVAPWSLVLEPSASTGSRTPRIVGSIHGDDAYGVSGGEDEELLPLHKRSLGAWNAWDGQSPIMVPGYRFPQRGL